jgi:hypothetical protein
MLEKTVEKDGWEKILPSKIKREKKSFCCSFVCEGIFL